MDEGRKLFGWDLVKTILDQLWLIGVRRVSLQKSDNSSRLKTTWK